MKNGKIVFCHFQKGFASNVKVYFIFLRKKGDFSDIFSTFYGQRSVTAAWATLSPWSIVYYNQFWLNILENATFLKFSPPYPVPTSTQSKFSSCHLSPSKTGHPPIFFSNSKRGISTLSSILSAKYNFRPIIPYPLYKLPNLCSCMICKAFWLPW